MKKLLSLTAIAILSFAFVITADAQAKKIGMKKAREIAMQRASGKIESSELEKENGKLIYSFDIRNPKGTITEVQVEAYTGKVVNVEEENAVKEAAEKRKEKKEKSRLKPKN
jgi:competence protein ComGC